MKRKGDSPIIPSSSRNGSKLSATQFIRTINSNNTNVSLHCIPMGLPLHEYMGPTSFSLCCIKNESILFQLWMCSGFVSRSVKIVVKRPPQISKPSDEGNLFLSVFLCPLAHKEKAVDTTSWGVLLEMFFHSMTTLLCVLKTRTGTGSDWRVLQIL